MFAYLIYSTNRLLAVEGNEILINGINLCDQTPKKTFLKCLSKNTWNLRSEKENFEKRLCDV